MSLCGVARVVIPVVLTVWCSAAIAEAIAEGTIRLVNGRVTNDTNTTYEGRVEIYLDGQWGTVCDDLWDIRQATVVCSQLGFLDATSAENSTVFGQGRGPIHLNNLNCLGNESTLLNCSVKTASPSNCNHANDAGVRCNPRPCPSSQLIRLVNGTVRNEGRVEVRTQCNADWGTVCRDYWNTNDARVACRQLGYVISGVTTYRSTKYGQGTGNILLDDLGCDGTEKNLFECQHAGTGIHNCVHSDDVGILCNKIVATQCHRIVSRNRVLTMRKYAVQKYTTRTGFLGWRRTTKYRISSVISYNITTVYSSQVGPCRVDGGWGPWKAGRCYPTCGEGRLLRLRTCNNPTTNGGKYCVGRSYEWQPCYGGCCPVNGKWSPWVYGPCNTTCGFGKRLATRTCNNPAPICGGKCYGSSTLLLSCYTYCTCRVPIHGGWSSWNCGSCSKTCGGGTMRCTRTCNNPTPYCGGNSCIGVSVADRSCNTNSSVDGGWSSWTCGPCSTTCGNGIRSCTRKCNNPTPYCGGNNCPGLNVAERSCRINQPVDGGWSSWTCGLCSKTCGTGTMNCTRKCDNPTPYCGGNSCLGSNVDERLCATQSCCPVVVNGGWSSWTCGSCSKSCGGTMNCTRKCDNPAPDCGGDSCSGLSVEERSCSINSPVDGGWSSWSCGSCSATCGSGIRSCTRRCNNPAPYCGGSDCSGLNVEERSCIITNPVDGGWSSWSCGSCNATCGSGIRSCTRRCDNPAPYCGGSDCSGLNVENRSCITTNAVDGGWSSWICGSCSKTCGSGTRSCSRTCSNPRPYCGGSDCLGSSFASYSCLINNPVNGGWSSWFYGSCSRTCGGGTRTLTRRCNSPAPFCGGSYCPGFSTRYITCNTYCCPVDGGWSSLTCGSCSRTCGGGVRRCTRQCTSPAPSCGGNYCPGSSVVQTSCPTICCPVDGGWSSWTQGSCSKTCGGGIKEYTRSCTNPTPSCGGLLCSGNSTREEACNAFCCSVDGGWSSWTQGSCSKSCGGGIKSVTRSCNNPTPSCGGLSCTGNSTREETCNEICCHVDGGWSSWTEGSCSKACGGGIKQFTRSCNNPTPSCGGLSCTGNSTYEEACNEFCCRTNGRWSSWRPVGKCSKTCGGGRLRFYRTCSNPAPSCGGSKCRGINIFDVHCNTLCCRVDGGWSNWTAGNCSEPCDGGNVTKIRTCNNPAPSCRGSDCVGESEEIVKCNTMPCIGSWSNWSMCSVSCGNGTKYRTRTCITDCENGTIQYKECDMGCCPVDGGWSSWYNQTECSVSCGGGVLTQWRNCTEPTPSCNGSECQGENVTTVDCNTHCCPVDGEWSSWYNQTECSVSCGGGVLTQWRNCTQPTPSCGGSECQGENVTTVDCNTHCCPVDGGWSNWSLGNCSQLCGTNTTKIRTCNNPAPSCGGNDCIGESEETVECNNPCIATEPFTLDGSWSNWSECSVTCGNGTKFRNRTCIKGCENGTIEYKECSNKVDGGWSEWRLGPCSKTCGGGVQNYTRVCDNPKPCGGKQCRGPSVYTYKEICNDECCPVDGGWSDWQNVTNCSTCGVITQQRTCTQPSPSCGGIECSGINITNISCSGKCCPVDGGWSDWQNVTNCSTTCGEGVITQQRTCTQPSPSCGGRDCLGENTTNVSCNNCCPVDGGWSEWEHGPCTKSCGGGKMSMIRKCNNPEPSCGGNECIGSKVFPLETACNGFCCPVDGGWSEWSNISGCSGTCGEGIQVQIRSCTEPLRSCGGKYCDGLDLQFVPCNVNACCPVNGNWSEWRLGPCSKTCGGGVQNYTRVCDNPKPSCGGEECKGLAIYTQKTKCNDFCCSVDGGWSDWLVGNCTVSCVKNRTRLCNNPTPSCGGMNCSGQGIEIMKCSEFPCEDGWGNWSECSVTCGNGTKFRTRECTGECKDNSIEIQYKPCYTGCCPVDGGWNNWVFGPCSKPCGGGRRNLTRECNRPKPSCNGEDCDGPKYIAYPARCNNVCCPVDGGWSEWNVGSCSVTCGGGIKEKFRLCDNPTPSCGGKWCSGSNIDNEECNESPCK